MKTSRLSQKSQVTIPKEVREVLGLEPGDVIVYELKNGVATLHRAGPLDIAFHASLSKILDEWDSPEDDEAFNDL
ncbi:MAG: AbrB/MazE/SpoVT family DNA-binding domain-containing protein [Deltaproteobacteria bacterium]|nr:AbrB/MazE/SpoVT family DNA-binding domain-containing protein [Deltaproteobacteria bacterium]